MQLSALNSMVKLLAYELSVIMAYQLSVPRESITILFL